jgi:TonB family protein
MRKTTFVRPLFCRVSLLLFVALGMVCLPAIAQDAATAATSANEAPAATLPSDPKALMLLAAKTNGLTGDDVKPWHLKASYTLYDDNGKESDYGTFEEWWAGEKLDKQVLTLGKGTWIETIDSHGDFETDRDNLPPELDSKISFQPSFQSSFLSSIRTQFVTPFPTESQHLKIEYTSKNIQSGTLQLKCLRANYMSSTMPLDFFNQFYCLSLESRSLRIMISSDYIDQVLRNDPKQYEGKWIPHELQFLHNRKVRIKAKLETLEEIGTVRLEDYTPLPGSILKQKTIPIMAAVTQGYLIKEVKPDYPMDAKLAGIQGAVVLRGVIGKDGHVKNLLVVSGPVLLQNAALQAVRQWKFKP